MHEPDPALELLEATDPSVRLQSAMTLGSRPNPEHIAPVIARCRVETDFYVREMLTWVLVHHDRTEVLGRLRNELSNDAAQARSQALHTLTKIADRATGEWITHTHLTDPVDEVARTAWRAAAELYPVARFEELLAVFISQLGRGDLEMHRSLARAFVTLAGMTGEDERVALALQGVELVHADAGVRAHAVASLRLLEDPESTFSL